MKTHATRSIGLSLVILASASAASAQQELPRADATGFIAWQVAETPVTDVVYRDNWRNSFFGGGAFGLYWTPHHKTELDFGASTTDERYVSRPIVIGGAPNYESSVLESSRRTLGIAQEYQFDENAWFHPYLGAGLHVTWEQRTERFFPSYRFDPVTGRTTFLDSGRVEGPATDVILRPFVSGGFKAYMAPRWFFRMDSRLAFKGGFDESQVRIGFGRDW